MDGDVMTDLESAEGAGVDGPTEEWEGSEFSFKNIYWAVLNKH